MFRTLLIAALPLAIASTATAQVWDGTPEDLDRIRQAVASELRDPPSAYFRDVEVRSVNPSNPTLIICGKVSGRNGYGGLGQPMLFNYLTAVSVLPESPGTSAQAVALRDLASQVWRLSCVENSTFVRSLDWNASSAGP